MSFLDKSLSYLSEALPIPGRAFSLRITFNHSLLNSLRYLLDVCNEVIPRELASKATKNLDNLNIESKLSGFLNGLHTDLFYAAQVKNIKKINNIIKKIAKNTLAINDVKYINLTKLNTYYVSLVKKIFSQEIPDKVKFLSLSQDEFDRVQYSIQHGVKILATHFPDYFKEFQELVSEILILKAQGLKAGSSSEMFGMIYKCYLHKWEKITDSLDFLIHEQSHLYVYLLNKDDQLVQNPSELHESPLRKEKRPLMGIYHATFVLARIYHVLNQALAYSIIPEAEKRYCQELLFYYKQRFHVGFTILQNHAQMTPLGKALIESASKLL